MTDELVLSLPLSIIVCLTKILCYHLFHAYIVPFDGTSMASNEQAAFQAVTRQCAADLDYFCPSSNSEQMGTMFSSNNMLSRSAITSRANNNDEMMSSFSRMMDSLMEEALRMPTTFLFLVPVVEVRSSHEALPEDIAAHHVISHVAAHTEVEAMNDVSERVQNHATALLQMDNVSSEKRRMARRLTQLATPQELHERRKEFLPFGRRNHCLIQAYDMGRLSNSCGHAIDRLRRIRMVQHLEVVERQKESQFVFRQISALYMFLAVTIIIMYWRRRNKRNTQLLRFQIIKAVYSKPVLKAALEKEIGESLGHVPPFSFRTLLRFGRQGQTMRAWSKTAVFLRRVCLLVSMILLWVAPLWFLPVCVLVSAANCWIVTCTQPPEPVCTCCLCGASTEHIASGELSEEQILCVGCMGTGVCSVNCPECGGATACQEDAVGVNESKCNADMWDKETCEFKKEQSKNFVYRGVPVQIV